VQPVLADGGELAAHAFIKIIDDLRVALHDALLLSGPAWTGPSANLEGF
jgi:hypothetical protein